MSLQIKRGTRAALLLAASRGEMVIGEPLLLSDESRIAVAISTTEFTTFAKESELAAPSIMLDYGQVSSGYLQTTDTAQHQLDSYAAGTWASCDYEVSILTGTSRHVAHLSVATDGTTIEFGWTDDMQTAGVLGNFDAAIVGGTVSILFTAASGATTTAKYMVTRVAA